MAKKPGMNTEPLKAFTRDVLQGRGPIRRVYKQWGVRYLAAMRRRFVRNSRGGGDWVPLKPTTQRRRRGKRPAILRDTSVLITALELGSPGNLFKQLEKGVRVGFGGPSRHPDGKATIADIARFHQNGVPERNLPARPILVEPDGSTRAAMIRDYQRGMDQTGKQAERRL